MEMADLPVAFGPKMADKLSASLSHQKKRVCESTPGILSNFADVIHNPCDRKSFLYWLTQDMTTRNFHKERLEIVAKAVTRVKDGSFEMIFVSAAKGKQKGFVKKFHECGVPKHQMII